MFYKYYEDNSPKIFTESQVKQLFDTQVSNEQKRQGTDLNSWLQEMKHMQILIPVEGDGHHDQYIKSTSRNNA